MFVLMFSANTIVTDRALLHVNSVTHLLHPGHAVLVLDIVTLLLIRGAALLLVLGDSLVLGATLLGSLSRHVRSIYGKSQ